MKSYWIIFIAAITLSILTFSAIIYKCFIQAPAPIMVYLTIDSLKEAGDSILDTRDAPNIYTVYPADQINTANDPAPWADVYVCRSFSKADSLSGDTALVILDTHTREDLKNMVFYDESFGNYFQAGIRVDKKIGRCRVLIPPNQVSNIKRYRYKLGKVKLIPVRFLLD